MVPAAHWTCGSGVRLHAPEFGVTLGSHAPSHWPSDGRRYDLSGHWGLGLGEHGTINLTIAHGQRGATNRAAPDPRDQITPFDADSVARGEVIRKVNQVPQPNHQWGEGAGNNSGIFVNVGYPLGEEVGGAELYGFGGYGHRLEQIAGLRNRGLDVDNWPQLYPEGNLPQLDAVLKDASWVTGVRWGSEDSTRWDGSVRYGESRVGTDLFQHPESFAWGHALR